MSLIIYLEYSFKFPYLERILTLVVSSSIVVEYRRLALVPQVNICGITFWLLVNGRLLCDHHPIAHCTSQISSSASP